MSKCIILGDLLEFEGVSPKIGANSIVLEGAKLLGNITIGEDCGIFYNVVMRGDENIMVVGDRTNIQDGTVVHIWPKNLDEDNMAGYPTLIGSDVTIGHACIIHACTIEDECLIGMGSTVMDGAFIGRGSIVGAGALITKGKRFPPNSLIMGSPAKLVREVRANEAEGIKASAKSYVDVKDRFIKNAKK